MLTALAEKPPASEGYRGSDLVLWRYSEVSKCAPNFRLWRYTGGPVRHTGGTSKMTHLGNKRSLASSRPVAQSRSYPLDRIRPIRYPHNRGLGARMTRLRKEGSSERAAEEQEEL